MVDGAGLGLGTADEGEAGSQGYTWHLLLQIILQTEAILDEDDEGGGLEQGLEQRGEQMVVDRLETHQHHVARGHSAAVIIYEGVRQMETAVAGVDLQTVGEDITIVAVEQKVNFLPTAS